MNRRKAITLTIGELDLPVITNYALGIIVHNIYIQKKYKGETISKLQKEFADFSDFSEILSKLLQDGILKTYKGFQNKTVYSVLGIKHTYPEDIVCSIDPFCYISHLSSMEYHGLTNRISQLLYVSSPSPKEWKRFAERQMKKDLGQHIKTYKANRLPVLKRIKIYKIQNREVYRFSSLHTGAFKNIMGRTMRVATIGRTFLDMLRNPDLCGGINHVLEVFEERGRDFIKSIIDEVNQYGDPIDKVRAGYILEERLNIKDKKIDKWHKYAQRGGSRKLDSTSDYEPNWSEKWSLSINI